MIIKEGQRIEVKGSFKTSYKKYIALRDFDTQEERWPLYDPQEKEEFHPLGKRCKIRECKKDGTL